MIHSTTIETVYSQVMNTPVFSEVDPDYRTIEDVLRITEDIIVRITESDDKRILE